MRATALVLVATMACVNAQHAEVKLANNPAGADCFSRCIAATVEDQAVDCVAACPGATRDSGDCESGELACVEHREAARGKTTWLIIGGIASFLILYAVLGGGGGSTMQ